ncbi:vacuolar membrane-associated protein iml-1 [Phlyctema vagabunda]|uniref:Vacuolar membrane-associated protein IML1 n=1 Tax=Phlyctema vagabunda TaxID=108571 RepID=A0ABR4PRR7_9HELO
MPSSTPRRGTTRPSHLRQVSNGSSETYHTDSSTGTAIQHVAQSAKNVVERRCMLWVHEEVSSKEDVLLNLDLFPDVKAGELMAIVALKTDSGVRDFQDAANPQKAESGGLAVSFKGERSSSSMGTYPKPNGTDAKHDVDLGKRYLFIARDMGRDMKAKHPGIEVSVAKHIGEVFYLKHRSNVLLTTVTDSVSSASHVELTFRDEYLARSDMWRLVVGDLSNKTVYTGQKILFMGTIKAQVTTVYVDGKKVHSAFFSTDTKPIFRSESARYVIFIQMSKEMWDFDSEGSGEIMFNKVVNGFLPALFKKWAALKARHLVSIVLFTRVEYDTGLTSELGASALDDKYHTGFQADGNKKPYKDFYRVVVSEMASGAWTTILYQLKHEFKFFRRDISTHRLETMKCAGPGSGNASGTRIEAQPSLAMYGNVLEAINMASSQFSQDHIDRDLRRTGISVVVVTPCAGLFEVDYEKLRLTTETLIGSGMGIDLVCLPKMPLHSVPLFRYRNPQYAAFNEAAHLKSLRSEDNTPRQNAPVFGSFSSMGESLSPTKTSLPERGIRNGSLTASDPPSEWNYAIPHWLDVSFWTGASQDLLTRHVKRPGATRNLKKSGFRRYSDFEIRCKMYELEMGSPGENVAAEIAVTPLQHDRLFPRMVIGVRKIPSLQQNKSDASRQIQRKKLYAGLLEYVSGASKSLVDRHTPQSESELIKVLESFDSSRMELVEFHSEVRHRSDTKMFFKTGSEDSARKTPGADSKLLSTSFDARGHTKISVITGNPTPPSNKAEPKSREPIIKTRKDSGGAHITSKVSPIRPPKFGRQISLGKFGFGIAAPKVATAELHTEHASAARPANTAVKSSDTIKKSSNMVTHLLGTPVQERPSSSDSRESGNTRGSSSTSSVDQKQTESEPPESPSVQPITIKSAVNSMDLTNQFKSRSILGSVYEGFDKHGDGDTANTLKAMKLEDNQKVYNAKLLAGPIGELPATLSPTTALSPWLTVLNPSNPIANDVIGPSQYRRWQHVFPRPISNKTMKWKSLCSPASVPLTTEYFPSKYQLDTEYQQKPYNISQNSEDDMNENPKTREEFLRELIGLRLSQGFQIVVSPAVAEAFGQKSMKIANVFNRDHIADDGVSVFMSMGNIIHQLSCVNGTEIEVNMFVRKPTASAPSSPGIVAQAQYNPAIRTTLAESYKSRQIILGKQNTEYNWNYVDSFIAGFDEEMSENLRFWRARFVLIPVERPTQSQKRQGEDNEEEIRLEGIKKLTQMWQRHRHLTPSERRFENKNLAFRKNKDPNPLDIVYKTEDPSVVITAELETLPLIETGETAPRRGQLMESERFRKSKLDVALLADAIQAPIERGGVRMQNRRWHFRLHYNCFIGSDMTTWLLENFEDIEDREDAVAFGNMLMTNEDDKRLKDLGKEKEKEDTKLFVHVEKRHPFRDGQYFYQITGEYAKDRPESRTGWFASKRRDASIPSTPMSESIARESPRPPERSNSGSAHDGFSSDSGANTPTPTPVPSGWKMPKVALSKVMKYDVDHRKRSYRSERINLHYDRLHNPDNCYHIRIDWMSVTAKLIEDAIEAWATTAERYGLRLVEAPINEACSITSQHPFRAPYYVKLSVEPPDQQPDTAYFSASSFTPQVQPNRFFYQKAIMKKFNFVLDIEAARNFPTNVDVTYSWGRPDFRYSQYIHRSGVVLAQITDDGNFLLLANRLYNNRTVAAREDRFVRADHIDRGTRLGSYTHGMSSDRATPYSSPALRPTYINSPMLRPVSADVIPNLSLSKLFDSTTPESIKNELESFCTNETLLQLFYKEVYEKATPPTPNLRSPYSGSLLNDNIPTLGLPPGILARDSSPSPMRLGSVPGVGSSAMQRRSSWQVGISNGNGNGNGESSSSSSARPIYNHNNNNNSPRGSIAEGDR